MICNHDLKSFAESIKQLSFPEKLQMCLELTTKMPPATNQVGLKWITDTIFIANVKIFARFIKSISNTVNYNFRHHLIKRLGRVTSTEYDDTMHWNQYTHDLSLFNRFSNQQQAKTQLKWFNSTRLNEMKNKVKQETVKAQIEPEKQENLKLNINIDDLELPMVEYRIEDYLGDIHSILNDEYSC
ncbi:hypothetical protein TRFO_42586 [Tritrichomonas foetus]|uniref:Initiator binding domain-containing protein n=1 Tax=Tritrichomonas foetus TaxID=1144522 RepID=A0A1J4L0F3_9EUKA|nr:hypothetical protein TRFO_42586 [Tritrichomonas foetus]|eukprot:OHT15333.1 hypothetical protein TRFO_42586 [Tritrichomonas foetus]